MSQTTHHGWTLPPLCPLAPSLSLAAPSARFVYLLASLLVVALSPKTPAAGAMPSNLLPQPPGHLFELWNHTFIWSHTIYIRHLAHLIVPSRRCITQTPPLHRQRLPKAPPKTLAPCCPIYQRHRRVINLIVVESYIYMKSYIYHVSYICMISYQPTCHCPCYQLPLLASFHSLSLVSSCSYCIMICLVTLNKCSISTMREVGGYEII